jgi:hypothetical protein
MITARLSVPCPVASPQAIPAIAMNQTLARGIEAFLLFIDFQYFIARNVRQSPKISHFQGFIVGL